VSTEPLFYSAIPFYFLPVVFFQTYGPLLIVTPPRQTRRENPRTLRRRTVHPSPYVRYRANIALRALIRNHMSSHPPHSLDFSTPRSFRTPSPPPYNYEPLIPSYSPIYPSPSHSYYLPSSPHNLFNRPSDEPFDPYLSDDLSTAPNSPISPPQTPLIPRLPSNSPRSKFSAFPRGVKYHPSNVKLIFVDRNLVVYLIIVVYYSSK